LPEPQDRSQPPAWLGVDGSVVVTWSGVIALVTAAAVLGAWSRFRLRRHPELREAFLQRYASWRLRHLIVLFVFYGAALFLLGWGGVVSNLEAASGLWALLPSTELLILAPFLTALVLSWACFYDVEKALHDADGAPPVRTAPETVPSGVQDSSPAAGLPPASGAIPYWSRWAYLGFHIRQNLALVVAPFLLLVVIKALPRLLPQTEGDYQVLAGGLSLGAALFVLAFTPWVMRLVLGLKSMPDGPLRDRLLAASRRLHFHCTGILIWNTRSGVANAMVVGLLPFPRYVVLTDRLLTGMTPDEVEAVFGHEVGHVKHRHMLYNLAFLLVSLVLLIQIYEVANLKTWVNFPAHQDLKVVPLGVLLGTYIFVVWGFLSRRCERQADIFGCRTVSCAHADCQGHDASVALLPGAQGLCPTGIHTFISALEKVAALNGISRDRPGWLQSWQHSTIARRVDFLQQVRAEPAVEWRFQRRVALVKWSLWLLFFAVAVVLAGAAYYLQ
jgi:Zn-dependent protease with chaperone function